MEREWEPYEYESWHNSINWDKYVDLANEYDFEWKDKKWLIEMQHRGPSWRQIKAAKKVVEKIDLAIENAEFDKTYTSEKDLTGIKHLTIRVAWHDNKWDGNVCKDPANNFYCNGYHSLLSERLRKRKNTELESDSKYAGLPISKIFQETGYLPPCFWTSNAFGNEDLHVEHDNPAEPALNHIKELLPKHSVLSWPFAVSFNRDQKIINSEGAYPANLEPVRIPHFQQKLKEGKSIVFLYANYDNPISGEDQEYLVVGVGLLKEKGSITRFNGQDEIIEKKTKVDFPTNKHFPRINWALRYTLDWPDNFVRLPYHEYLKDAEETKNYERLEKLMVSISEPELIHNFKYVAMDIDDDACIYILTKIKQKLNLIRDENIVPVADIKKDLRKIETFIAMAWEKRGYLPGLNNLSRTLLRTRKDEVNFTPLFNDILQFEEDPIETFRNLLIDPQGNPDCRKYISVLEELRNYIKDNLGIPIDSFLQLAMLNLTEYQFDRIIYGKILEDDRVSLDKVCNNPYLLYEQYVPHTKENQHNGELEDFPIELFKIDIAYFPNTSYLERLELQKKYSNTDKRRIRALIIQHLKSLESYGHCFDSAGNIEQALADYPLFYQLDEEYRIPEDFLLKIDTEYEAHLADELEIINENNTKYFYLNDIYNAEQVISDKISTLLEMEPLTTEFEGCVDYITTSSEYLSDKIVDFDPELFQQERNTLFDNIFKQRLFVLTGTPGSGKSFELLKVISELKEKNEKYLLLAPTGKAVLRLSSDPEFPEINAMTIDKFLNLYKFKPSQRDKEYNNIIIDEMSMVDLIKFEQLLRCFNFNLPSFNRLILVGDPYQLPPIGFGKVFIDIVNHIKNKEEFKENFIQLESNCRQTMDPEIVNFSSIYSNLNIASEDMEEKISAGGSISSNGGFNVYYWQDEQQLIDGISDRLKQLGTAERTLSQVMNDLIGLGQDGKIQPKKDNHFNIDGFQILTPYRTGQGGSGKINTFFQETIRKSEPFLKVNKLAFKHTDKVIQTINVYEDKELVLSNGSMGLAYSDGKPKIIFPENNFEQLSFYDSKLKQENLELAYSITVHKAQGSGFDHVFVVIPNRMTLLSKELLYTALTRSRKTLSVFVHGHPGQDFKDTLFNKIRSRSYTDTRRTSILGLPFWDYSLEPEKGIYVQSKVEYIIYKKLQEFKAKNAGFDFRYEVKPTVNGVQLKMKTDFTVITTKGKIFYWEHLGLLGNVYYERKWKFKWGKYSEADLADVILTTDDRHGINEDKIYNIICLMADDKLGTEDKYNKYSQHHYYLR